MGSRLTGWRQCLKKEVRGRPQPTHPVQGAACSLESCGVSSKRVIELCSLFGWRRSRPAARQKRRRLEAESQFVMAGDGDKPRDSSPLRLCGEAVGRLTTFLQRTVVLNKVEVGVVMGREGCRDCALRRQLSEKPRGAERRSPSFR